MTKKKYKFLDYSDQIKYLESMRWPHDYTIPYKLRSRYYKFSIFVTIISSISFSIGVYQNKIHMTIIGILFIIYLIYPLFKIFKINKAIKKVYDIGELMNSEIDKIIKEMKEEEDKVNTDMLEIGKKYGMDEEKLIEFYEKLKEGRG